MTKYVDIEKFYKDIVKEFKCNPLVGSNENDMVPLKDFIEDAQGIYMSENITNSFTKEDFLTLLYSCAAVNSTDEDIHRCADKLTAMFKLSINSVIPCGIGDTLYFPIANRIEPYKVKEIRIVDDGTKIVCYNVMRDVTMTLYSAYIGKTIFLSLKEAEDYLNNKVTCDTCGFARERTDHSYHCCRDNTIHNGKHSCGEGRKYEN